MTETPTAIILSGGYGTRLRPLTYFTPKPLIKINGKMCIDYVIDSLHEAQISNIYIKFHYKPLQFLKKLGDRKIVLTYEPKLLDTAVTINKLIDFQTENFIVCNGDTITTLDIGKMYEMHCRMKKIATVAWDKGKCTGVMIFNKNIGSYLTSDSGMIDDVLNKIDFTKYYSEENKYWDIGTWEGLRKAQKDATVNLLSKLLP